MNWVDTHVWANAFASSQCTACGKYRMDPTTNKACPAKSKNGCNWLFSSRGGFFHCAICPASFFSSDLLKWKISNPEEFDPSWSGFSFCPLPQTQQQASPTTTPASVTVPSASGISAAAGAFLGVGQLTTIPTMPPSASSQIYAYDLVSGDLIGRFKEVAKQRKCIQCSRELSSYLDAYYGQNPIMAEMCVKCRA